jgi:hypothetical protein
MVIKKPFGLSKLCSTRRIRMNDLFKGDQSPVDQKNYLQELVGENRKFKDVESLARGKAQSDDYIKTLEMKLDEYRTDMLKLQEESNKRATLEELLDQIKRQPEAHQEPEVKPEPKPYRPDPREIESLVDSKLTQREQTKKEQENYNFVRNRIQERFGQDYQAKLNERISELDMSPEEVNLLARRSPKILLKALDLDQDFKPDTFGAPRSQNTFKPNPPEKRTWSWYQKLKQTDPAEYRSAKTNVQMHNDMMSLGEEFMDGDYFVAGLHEATAQQPATPRLRY